MAWSNEEISQFQIDNNKALAEINATLNPDEGLVGSVGVFLFGQAGDLATATSVLKYRNEIFGNKKIIWFANYPHADILRYAPISEVRPWPWAGNGLPLNCPDYWPLLCTENNTLNLELAAQFEDTKDLIGGFFPAPYMIPVEKRHGWDYPNCSRKIFGVPDDWDWHPVISHSHLEECYVRDWIFNLPERRNIIFETFAGSDQSKITHEMIVRSIEICREQWKDCNIIFVSHKYLKSQEKFPESFFEQPGIYSASHLTVRECGLLTHWSKLMISVSSGIAVACSAWGMKPIPIIQFTGSFICSTKSLALGQFELVTYDDKPFENAKEEFYNKLTELLNQCR